VNIERAVVEYLEQRELHDRQGRHLEVLKKMLVDQIKSDGVTDSDGHKRLGVGDYELTLQRRLSGATLDREAATEWAEENEVFENVSRRVLDEDLLLAYVYEHPECEAVLQSFYSEQKETFAFLKPERKPPGSLNY
jgi:hypothetical protein